MDLGQDPFADIPQARPAGGDPFADIPMAKGPGGDPFADIPPSVDVSQDKNRPYKVPERGWFKEQRPKTQTTVSPLPEGYGKGNGVDLVADTKEAASGVVADTKAAIKSYMDMTPSEKLKFHASAPLKAQKVLAESLANVPITAASTLASIPNLVLPSDTAKNYTEWVQQNTGLMTGDPFAQADEEIKNPAERMAAKATRLVANAAPAVLLGAAAPELLPEYMGAESAGNFLAEAGAKGTPVLNRTLGAGASWLLGKAQGGIPLGRTAEAVLTKGGSLSPIANRVIADTAAAADMAGFQGLQNAVYRSSGVDPNRDLTEGMGTAALTGVGFREAHGGFGRSMTNVPEPETYSVGPNGVSGPRVFQQNILPRVAPEANNLDQAFYQKQMAPLADLMAMDNAMKGPWSKLPDQAKVNAGRWFEVNDALADHPTSPALQAELASIPLDAPTKQAIEILKWAKQEQANAVNQSAAMRGEEPPTPREYYLPRRVQMEAGEAPVQTASTTANATRARTMMALIDAQGNRRIVNADEVSPGGNETMGQATRAEIEAATGLKYGRDDFAELLNSTAQARAATRAASIGRDIKRVFGTTVPQGGKVPEGYTQFTPDHPAHALVGDTPIRADAAKVVDFYTNHKQSEGPLSGVADVAENIKRDVMNIGFLNPIIHPPNQFTHYFKAGGLLRMLNPKMMGGDLAEATVKIAQFDPEYQKFLLSGGAAMRRQAHLEQTKKTLNQALEDPRLQKVLDDLKARGEEGFLPKALTEVVNGPVWLLDDAMRFDLWRKKVAKGMTPTEASASVDRDFPSYRNPVLLADETGKASGAKKLGNAAYNTLFNMERGGDVGRILAPYFMKFRYGAWSSTINTLRKAVAPEGFSAKEQLTNPAAWKQRVEAADKIAAIALLGSIIYPALDVAYSAALSEPEKGLKYKARRAGPLHQFEQVKDVIQGDKTVPQFVQEFAMPNPVVRGVFAAAGYDPYFNRALPEGTKLQTAASAISPVQDLVQTFGEGKPGTMAIAKQLMAKRDRTELEQFVARTAAQGMGQMKEDTVDSYRLKNKLFKAWDDKDAEAAKNLEAEAGDEKKVAKWRKEYETSPNEAMALKMRRFDPKDLIEAAKRAEGSQEKSAVASAIAHKMASKTIKPAERLALKALLARLQKEGASTGGVPVDVVEVPNENQ